MEVTKFYKYLNVSNIEQSLLLNNNFNFIKVYLNTILNRYKIQLNTLALF